jgi:hypothetical protein
MCSSCMSCHLHLMMCLWASFINPPLPPPHCDHRGRWLRVLCSVPTSRSTKGPTNMTFCLLCADPPLAPALALACVARPHLAPFPVCSHHVLLLLLLLLLLQVRVLPLERDLSVGLELQDPDLVNFKHWYTVAALMVVCDLTCKYTFKGVPAWLWVPPLLPLALCTHFLCDALTLCVCGIVVCVWIVVLLTGRATQTCQTYLRFCPRVFVVGNNTSDEQHSHMDSQRSAEIVVRAFHHMPFHSALSLSLSRVDAHTHTHALQSHHPLLLVFLQQ